MAACLLIGWGAPGRAQEADAGAEAAESQAERPLDRTSPRGALFGFLVAGRQGEYAEAASYLNLAPVPERHRDREGPKLARQLKLVLDRTLWVDLEALSDAPEGHTADGLPARRDRVGRIDAADGSIDIFVDRVSRDGVRVWEVSSTTVARIPALYEEFGYGRLGERLPDFLLRSELFDLLLWQWIALLGLVAVASVVSWLLTRVVLVALHPLAARSETDLDDKLLAAIRGPLRLGLGLAFFAAVLLSLGLTPPALRFFVGLEKALAVVAVTWLLVRLVDIFGSVFERRLERRGDGANAFVPMGRKAIKTAIVLLAALAALDSFGFDITALIAGLGVGGLAVALAAQRPLENLFGGATLIADRPVRVGDFCRFGEKLGVIEEIGLRSTRVRTLDRTLVTVPNAEFSRLQLENFAVRDKILYKPRLGLRYETTSDQLRYALSRIKRVLDEHPRVDPDPARVRFVGFGDSSLDVDIWAYITATDFSEYLEISEDLNLQLMDAVAEAGTGFAFPSTTAYLAKDDGLDEAAARRAAELGSALRSQEPS